jgi:hypothetical protein
MEIGSGRYISESEKDLIGRKCCNCGSAINLMYHHIVPLVYGGKNIISNIACVCEKCHSFIHHDGASYYNNHAELIRKGIAKAKNAGIKIGLKKGTKLTTQKSVGVKEIILNNSKDFNGTLDDKNVIVLSNCSRNSFYKYKRELKKGRDKEKME